VGTESAVKEPAAVPDERASSRSLPRWPERQDLVVAAILVGAGQVVVWAGWIGEQPQHGPRWENALVSALALSTVAWRRSAPLAAVVAYTIVFCFLQPLAPHDLPVWTGFLPLVILTVSAAYRTDFVSACIALAVALAGLTVLTTVEPVLQSWDTYIFNAALVVPAWVAARSLARRNDRAAQLSVNLAELHAAQEERERRVVADEKARIARELHDVVAHSVTVLLDQVGSARVSLATAPEQAQDQLLAAEESGRQALEELRRLLRVLRTTGDQTSSDLTTVPQPGLGDLRSLIATFQTAGTRIECFVTGESGDVGPGLGVTVYRIVQEALTNAVKHAPGSRIVVRIRVDADEIRIQVTDDGRSADASSTEQVAPGPPGAGLGLVGIRERVSLFGGRFSARPSDQGWTVSATLPRSAAGSVVEARG